MSSNKKFEVVSEYEVYMLDENGDRGKRVCGAKIKDGGRCKIKAGAGTDHTGIGRCVKHDGEDSNSSNWLEMVEDISDGSALGKALERSKKGEVAINDVTEELLMQRGLLMWYIDHVMDREGETEFTPKDIKIIKRLNKDLIKTKESAAKIKGSLKLDAVTVKKFVDQLMTFLVGELESKLKRNEVMAIMEKMMEEVFIPMASRGMINGDLGALTQLPDGMKSMSMVDNNEAVNAIEEIESKEDSDG